MLTIYCGVESEIATKQNNNITGIIIIRIAGADAELSVEKTKYPVPAYHFLTIALLIAEICEHYESRSLAVKAKQAKKPFFLL